MIIFSSDLKVVYKGMVVGDKDILINDEDIQ